MLFFFMCYADPRDLHSFPTRRSSDLAVLLRLAAELDAAPSRLGWSASATTLISFLTELTPCVLLAISIARSASADRKSTRLNSSHSQISYAVFCLKKKKKNNKDNQLS